MTDPERSQPNPTAQFDSVRQAASFVAKQCGLTIEDVRFDDTDPDRVLAYFPGRPGVALAYYDREQGTYHPTAGAADIISWTQTGKVIRDKLTTPWQQPVGTQPYPPLSPAKGQDQYKLLVSAGDSPKFVEATPLLQPDEAEAIDPVTEVTGTLEIIEVYSADGPTIASVVLEDGTRVPLTPGAVKQLRLADAEVGNLNGQTGVFRVANVPPNNASPVLRFTQPDGTPARDGHTANPNDDTVRTVVEVYFKGE